MTDQQLRDLRMPFKAEEIEWLISATNKEKTSGYAAPYVDSRAVQERLDTVLGWQCWQNNFVFSGATEKEPGAHICEISIKTPDMPEWITKSDGAGSTDIDPIKGGLSGAMKRAASMWGVGRYLYVMKGAWVNIEQKGRSYVIPECELKRLANFYNNKLAKMYGSMPSDAQMEKAYPEPAYQPQAVQPASAVQPVQQAPATRQTTAPRQTPAPASQKQAQASVQEFYQVQNVKTTKGGNGAQTFVALQKNTGEQLGGYIQGDAGLVAGQKLFNLQITKKSDPNYGEYNIINDYAVAA